MVDTSRITQGTEPTGGKTPFRRRSDDPVSGNGPGGNGQTSGFTARMPRHSRGAAITRPPAILGDDAGGERLPEFIVGFTLKFPKNYTALGTGDWTVTASGTSAAGTWRDDVRHR